MSKHQQGPWKANGAYVEDPTGVPIRIESGWIDGVWLEDEAAHANARLIAAAPDLLAALRLAREFISNGVEFGFIRMPDPDVPDSAHGTLPAIEAAIAKAEGRDA